jgi:hypothetical protein
MTPTQKAKAGDLVALRRSRAGSAPGLHLVLKRVARGLDVLPMNGVGQHFTAPDEDVVGLYVSVRPAEEAVNLDPRPLPPVEVQPAPPKESEPTVVISVPDPARPGYAFPAWADPSQTTYLPEDSPHLNHNRISRKVIRVPASLVDVVLANVDGTHLVGERPRPAEAFAREQD